MISVFLYKYVNCATDKIIVEGRTANNDCNY